jgi:chemotaxis protein methyltransferase WspC
VIQTAEQRVVAILEVAIGLDWRSIGHAAVTAAIATRCRARALEITQYADALLHDMGERQALINEVVVPETWFMRDSVPFSNLALHAIATLSEKQSSLKILSVPCATGEEPFSVAMSLLTAGIEAAQFHIDAVDVCDRSVRIAQTGRYRSSSFRGNDLNYRARYFDHCEANNGDRETWQIREQVQRCVTFNCANVLSPGFMAGRRYDIVLCRNLIIYLTEQARSQILDALFNLMSPDSILVAGHAEHIGMMDSRFSSIAVPHSFSYRKTRPQNVSVVDTAAPRTKVLASSKVLKVERMVPTLPMKPSPLVTTEVPEDLLARATRLADTGELTSAEELCQRYLHKMPMDANGWVLLGNIQQANNNPLAAERSFSRAVFCEPSCYQALVHLALLLERRGDLAGAANMKRRAAKVIEATT